MFGRQKYSAAWNAAWVTIGERSWLKAESAERHPELSITAIYSSAWAPHRWHRDTLGYPFDVTSKVAGAYTPVLIFPIEAAKTCQCS
jgi:hypothetical protein